ncbi:endonuclease/exonuclease/phosphatase family protein [Halpernia sp.]|uniref:endonuclease/exonuclease/phosphatase family protein n=1 Tax=Halpernia sp. TaxID=2782209 RepID=UPI003A918867
MKQYLIVLLMSMMSFTSCKAQNLSVMTYNIRLDIASDGENAWAKRKDFFSSQVQFYSPDILGVQEARTNQMQDLKDALTDYKAIGIGRDGGDKGEHSSIFYNTKKLKVENTDTFWLSETPTKFSKGWDAAYPRICTYGLFTILKTKQKVWIFNTHLDNIGAKARSQGMQLILKKINEVNTQNFPVILTGDFNVDPDDVLLAELKQRMIDSKDIAKIKFGPQATFNDFKYNEPATRRIDYIMLSKPNKFEVEKYGVLTSAIDSKYPSDHFPVLVELKLK